MSDIEVFFYVTLKKKLEDGGTRRLGTMESIKKAGGEAIMETKRIVDSGQLDADGFLEIPVSP